MSSSPSSTLGQRGGQPVRRWLLDMLASGRYAAGARLPTERAMAAQLAVPRSAVRNALAALEAEGVLVRLIGSGTFVAEAQALPVAQAAFPAQGASPRPQLPPGHEASPTPEKQPAPETQPALVAVSDASPTQIMEARLLIEPRMAALAVAHATVSDFERMEACNRHAEGAGSFEMFEHWDAALHQAIAEATHNRLIVGLYTAITRARDQADWGELKRRSLSAERRDAYRAEHRRIVAALRSRDAEAAEAALLEHLRHVRQNLLGI